MIQSYKLDSLKMNIKDLSIKTLDFAMKRIAEIIGVLLICLSILLFLSLITYSPEDPNFMFNENIEIKNLLGFRGSYSSDLLFQSVGLISYLISFTVFFTGINLIKSKNFLIILENIFYGILYTIIGSFFLTSFYPNSFWLYINGNGGFVGIFLQSTFLTNIINLNKDIAYFVIFILIVIIFLISINFSLNNFIKFNKKIFLRISKFKNKNKNIENFDQEEDIEFVEESEKPIQEDLPFNKKFLKT